MTPDDPSRDRPAVPQSIHAGSPQDVERQFHDVYERCLDPLCRYVRAYVSSGETAKEIVNDAFFQLWVRLDAGDSIQNVQAYLYATARHRSIDYLRRRNVATRHVEGELQRRIGTEEEPVPAEGEQLVAERELVAAIQRAVDALPRRQRDVILLKWQRQATHDEIAQELGIASKTVAEHFRRALEHLRETLASLDPDEPA